MLDNLSEEIRGRLRYAEDCARKAKETNKPKLREESLWKWSAVGCGIAHRYQFYQFAKKLKNAGKPRI